MEENHSTESDFMKETIKQRPINRRKLLRRTLITAAMAVVFGLVACLTFLLLEPVISNKLYPEEEPSYQVIFEEESEEEEILPEDMFVDDSQMQPEITEPPALEDEQIAQVLSEMELGVTDYESLYSALSDVAKEVQKSMVTVVGVTSDVDWFNNPFENESAISGIIVADNEREFLILANINSIENSDFLEIIFADDNKYDAAVKRKDNNTGLAVLSVPKAALQEGTLEAVQPAVMGTSSSRNLPGSPVIAVGQPMGVANSLCYGFVTSTSNSVRLPDSGYRWITTDIYGSTNASGVLVNLKGQVIGVIDTENNNGDIRNLVGALGITELKRVIEALSNDREIPYLGIYGADVTLEANEELGVPYGAYITEIDMESPAMEAGLQSGDVITRLDDSEIGSRQALVISLLEREPEQTVNIGFYRQGPEGYTEMELNVILGRKE